MSAVVLDFNDARPNGHFSGRQLDDQNYVRDLKARLEANAESVLAYLWPAGRVVSGEFCVGSINGERGESLKVSLKRGRIGVGRDFAGNEATGDLIDCWAYATRGRKARGRDFGEVCEEAEAWLGTPTRPAPRPAEKAKKEDLGPPTATYPYTDAAGSVLCQVVRFDPPGGKKTFRQHPPMPETGRPLFNLPAVTKAAQVVFTEGEKAATALIAAGIVATCAMGGSKAPPSKTDWAPLARKRVVIWPDADEPGLTYAEAVRIAIEDAGGTALVMQPPEGKADGWDAADAIEEGLDPSDLLRGFDPPRAGRNLDLAAWAASSFVGEPKPIAWLLDGLIPLGTAGLLAAMGDAGKGIMTLDLALKVAAEKPDGLVGEFRSFGAQVATTGAAVILAAEDDRDTIHRRLHGLDPDGSLRASGRLYVVPLPNAGGPLPIIKTSSTSGPYATPEWEALKASLASIPDLRLVVLDPLASFVHADVNADPAAGAFVTGLLASLATETGATILVPHHMAKRQGPITTPEDARATIRGSTAIVDGLRFAYAIWQPEENIGRRVCQALDIEWQRNRVMQGAVVKSNAPAERGIRTFVRDLSTGLLVDRTEALKANKRFQKDNEMDELEAAIASAAAQGFPFSYSGSTGLYERPGELPPCLQRLGKHSIRSLADELLRTQRIVRVRHKGQSSPWLDIPKGDFALGKVDLAYGAQEVDDVPGS